MKWTESQQRAINSTKKKVIVSAAAGSGKTGVLTERVIRLVKQKNDIRRMLIMTFTNAAAGEMKKRIIGALTKEAENAQSKDVDEADYLYKQAEYADCAHISTFHSFCIELLRENFNISGVSPNFKMLSDNEANALRYEAMRDVLDELYEKRDEDLIRLLARYTSKYNENELVKILLAIYDRARAQTGLFKWITDGAELAPVSREDRIRARADKLYDEILPQMMYAKIKDIVETIENVIKSEEPYCAKKLENHQNCINDLKGLYGKELRKIYKVFGAFKISNYSKNSEIAKQFPADILNKIYSDIAGVKTIIKNFTDLWGDRESGRNFEDREAFVDFISEELAHTDKDARAEAEIIKKFDAVYADKKKERNGLDFDDTLIKTIEVLEKNSDVALMYDYIFVDEYQDTNPVQDRIIDLLKRDNPDVNLFMVGDMKQSVYKFRNADPRAFKGKAENYRDDASHGELITMNENFRSSLAVIEAVNGVMENVMNEEFGEVEYGDEERLISNRGGGGVELLLGEYERDEEPIEREILTDGEIKTDIEAQAIADSIESVLNERGPDGSYKYKPDDIAVLARKLKNNDVVKAIMKKLREKGILYSLNNHEVSDTPEIELFVNLLKIINNPTNDIALVSVMKSEIGGFDDNLLAEIHIAAARNEFGTNGNQGERKEEFYGKSFFEQLKYYAHYGKDEKGAKKAYGFIKLLEELQLQAQTEALADFVNFLRDRFNFDYLYTFVRNGNLKRGVFEKFMRYVNETCSYTGNNLYKLITELEAEKKRSDSYINVKTDDNIPAVSIMTMHKSKGLEFPVVYLAALGSKLSAGNKESLYRTTAGDGLILPYRDEKTHVKKDGIALTIAKEKFKKEEKSELLRLLYVAMTRAGERLYLSGIVDKENAPYIDKNIDIGKADTMLDWVIAAKPQKYGVKVTDTAGTYRRRNEEKTKVSQSAEERISELTKKEGSERILTPARFEIIPQKMSVSDIKEARADGGAANKFKVLGNSLKADCGDGQDGEREITGPALGTLIHKVMEYIAKYNTDAETAAKKMKENNLISDAEYEAVIINKFMADEFLNSRLYERMKKSERVLEEQRFLLNVPACRLGYESEKSVTVQGVLDAAFTEDGGWVLIDYKTDNVKGGDIDKRAEFYKVQLDLYSDALKEITGLPVKERYLYFLKPGELRAV